jgi:glycosyltransferase involved in cell wall biosynthesis
VLYSAPKMSCRLLYVIGQLRLGGAERQLYYLLATLDRSRYQPALVAWNVDPSEKYYRDIQALKVPIYGLPAGGAPISKLLAFRRLARKISPEVIHSYGFHTNFAAYCAARAAGSLAIGSLRSDFADIKKVGGSIRGALNARWPCCHISNSVVCAEAALRSRGAFAPRQILVVRNGLDINKFRPSHQSFKERNYVAAVGSLFPVKRWDRLLRVIQKVRRSGECDTRFRIAGDGPLRSDLKTLAQNLGILESVEFVGENYDIPEFLRGAKFLVHTSQSEGCPNVVMEAMACGLPVVAMDAGDISCLIDEGRSGFVVPQNDEHVLAERIMRLLNDQSLAHSLGLAGREKAEKNFNLERLVSETLNAYKTAGWRTVTNGFRVV